jgi:hypothetical protein
MLHFPISVRAADQLLRGLPSLEHLEFSASDVAAAASGEQQQQQQQQVGAAAAGAAAAAAVQQGQPAAAAPVTLQHFPSGLTHLRLGLQGSIGLDGAALAACSRLQEPDLDLGRLEGSFSHISGLAALMDLESLIFEPADMELHGDMLAAVSQLPLLQSLTMMRADIVATDSGPEWGHLAAMPALQDLEVMTLELDLLEGAAPLRITSLVLYHQLLGSEDPATGQVPKLQPGCLAALLPELQPLEVLNSNDEPADCRTYGCHTRIAAALQGHQHLQHLEIHSWDEQHTDDEWEPPCCQQHMRGALASLQQLRTVRLLQCACQHIDEVLAVLAGCPQLQELEVAHGRGGLPRRAPEPPELEGRGLEQLALGACAGTLRQMALCCAPFLEIHTSEHVHHGFSMRQVARLLDGSCPQLQELELQVLLEPPPLMRQVLLQQQPLVRPVAADLAAFQSGQPVSELLLCSMEDMVEELNDKMKQLVGGGQASDELRWDAFESLHDDSHYWRRREFGCAGDMGAAAPVPVVIKGAIGGIRVEWTAEWHY